MVPLEILRILTTIRQSLRISVTKEFNALAREMIELKFKLRSAWCQCSWTFHLLVPSSLTTFLSINKWIGFPYFLQFKSEFGNKEFMIWATISSQSCFYWRYRASPSLSAKNRISLISVVTIWWCPCVESSLVLLEESICYDQCVLLAKLY